MGEQVNAPNQKCSAMGVPKALAGVAARDLAVQLGCAAVAIHQQTEVFYDFSASCTYVYLVIQSLFGQAPGGKPRMRAYLLTQVSGVPLLRQANLKKWGTDAAYQKYLSETPLLWPFMKMPTL